MNASALRARTLAANFAAFGVSATVQLPGGVDPISTRIVWMTPTGEQRPTFSTGRHEPQRVIALRRNEVPSAPKGTVIVAAERTGDPEKTWIVDDTERQEVDHVRVIVIEQVVES